MNRSEFLQRVGEAARAGRAHRVAARPYDPAAGYVGGGDDPCRTLADEVAAVGGRAAIVDSVEEARQTFNGWLAELQPRRAACWRHELLAAWGVPRWLDEAEVAWHDHARWQALSGPEQRRAMLAAEVGVSGCDYALAETGTLVLCSRPGQERVVSLLPPVHLALVAESQIVPDLFDLFERLEADSFDEQPPSNLTLITGPSKTGDIELQLTTGVHGPGDWRVILIRGV